MTVTCKIKERIETWRDNPFDFSSKVKKEPTGSRCYKKILVESYGINRHLNNFYLVLRESEHTAVISEVTKQKKSDIWGQSAWEMSDMTGLLKDHDFQLVNKSSINDETYYHLNDHSLMEWQGNPLEFNFSD